VRQSLLVRLKPEESFKAGALAGKFNFSLAKRLWRITGMAKRPPTENGFRLHTPCPANPVNSIRKS